MEERGTQRRPRCPLCKWAGGTAVARLPLEGERQNAERSSALSAVSFASPGSKCGRAAASIQLLEKGDLEPLNGLLEGPGGGWPGPEGSLQASPHPGSPGPPVAPSDFHQQFVTLSPHGCAPGTCSHNSKVACGDSHSIFHP